MFGKRSSSLNGNQRPPAAVVGPRAPAPPGAAEPVPHAAPRAPQSGGAPGHGAPHPAAPRHGTAGQGGSGQGGSGQGGVIEGGRAPIPAAGLGAPLVAAPTPSRRVEPSPPLAPTATDSRHSEAYYEVKSTIFGALIEAIDLSQLAKLDADSSREEIRDIVNEIIAIKAIVMSISEQEDLLDDICNDVLGYGPLEPLLARDDIADIMVNGSGTTYIEVKGKIQKTGIRFRDNQDRKSVV